MFCHKCGAELPEGTPVCTVCGTTTIEADAQPSDQINTAQSEPVIPPPQIYADNQETPINPPPQKVKKKGLLLKIVAILLLAVIFISGVAVLGYFTFLPAKMTLKTAQYLTVQKQSKQVDRMMDRYQTKVDAMTKEPYSTKGEINVSVDPSIYTANGMDAQTAELVDQYVKNMAITFNMASDIPAKKQTFSMGVNYQKNPILSFSGFMDNKRIGFSLPELSQKVITGEFKDIPRLAELYPDQFDSYELQSLANMDPWAYTQIMEDVKIQSKDITEMMKTYSTALVDSLESSDMTIKRGRQTEILGKNMSCQEITVKLDQKAQRSVVVDLLDTVKNDEKLYELIFGNMIKIYDKMVEQSPELAQMSGTDISEALSKSNFKKMITLLKASLKADMFPEEAIVKIYIKDFDVVKYVFSVTDPGSGDTITLSYEQLLSDDANDWKITMEGGSTEQSLLIALSGESDYDKASDTQDTLMALDADYINMGVKNGIHFTLDSKEDPAGKGKIKRDMNIDMNYDTDDGMGDRNTGKFNLAVEGDETRNNKGLYTGGDYKIHLDMTMPNVMPQAFKMAIAYTNTTTYGEKVEIPDLKNAEVLDLATATQADFDAYSAEINEKLALIQMLFGGQ